MDPQEIDQEIAAARRTVSISTVPPSPPPAAPTSSPLGQFAEMMQAMVAMEQYKESLLRNERERERSVEIRLRERIEKEFAAQATDDMDPGVKTALELLVDAFKSSIHTPNPPGVVPPPIATPEPAQPAQAPKEEPMREFTQQDADAIADKIFEKFPGDVRAAQNGIISKEEAIAKIVAGGLSHDRAEMVYNSLMETDYEGGESDAVGSQ